MGYELLLASDLPTLREAAIIAYCHHERPDGLGYPRQRAAEEIPLTTRIVSVADVFDALTSDRSYRPALSDSRVCELLRQGGGSQFDPDVLDAFLRVLEHRPALGQRLRAFTQSASEPAPTLLKNTRPDAVADAVLLARRSPNPSFWNADGWPDDAWDFFQLP